MKVFKSYILLLSAMLVASCSDDLPVEIAEPGNITFDELKLSERFSHAVPQGGFSCNGIKFNTVKSGSQLEGGFCYSNRSYRSFVWTATETAVDSVRYSVYTATPNRTGTYLVCHVNNDDAFFTLDKPTKLEYILVANTTWNYLGMLYGEEYSNNGKPIENPSIPSKPMGIWHSNIPGGAKKFGEKDWLTVIAKGYLNGKETGSVACDLFCSPGHNMEHPTWSYLVNNWRRMDLAQLGTIDKVVFYMDSSDKDESGKMRTPAWFCIDGIQPAK